MRIFLTLWIDVACLEWRQRIADQVTSCHGRMGYDHCRMKLCLQKRLGPDSASFGKTSRLLFGRFCMDCSAFRQGNQVAVRGDIPTVPSKGNRSHWQQRAGTGEIQLDHMAQSLHAGSPSLYFFQQVEYEHTMPHNFAGVR